MKQTPKEKAKELFTHYHNLIQDIGGELGQEILVSILAKECALFLVREKEIDEWKAKSFKRAEYWNEVEYELDNYEE
jgi:hypothetical protein